MNPKGLTRNWQIPPESWGDLLKLYDLETLLMSLPRERIKKALSSLTNYSLLDITGALLTEYVLWMHEAGREAENQAGTPCLMEGDEDYTTRQLQQFYEWR